MKYPWFRFYVEAVHDRKLRRLKPEHRWLFVACLSAARESPKPGWLLVGGTPMQWDDLTDYACLSLKTVEVGLSVLQEAGLIGWSAGCYFIPKWDERQFASDSSAERTRNWRHRKQVGDVTVTPQDTEADTENPPNPPRGGRKRSAVQQPDPPRPVVPYVERCGSCQQVEFDCQCPEVELRVVGEA